MDRLPLPHGRGSDSSSVLDIARHRRTDPRSLAKQLRGDLDWIVMKCLEKERARRYETANGLAADLQRHLSDEPVEASPPSASYRFRKFARRNKAALITTTAVAASLIIGLTLATVGLVMAMHERDRAEAAMLSQAEQHSRAEANFQKARDAVDQMLTEVGQKDLADVPGMEPVRRRLLTRALQFYEQFLVEQGDDPAIQAQIGRAHGRVANIRMLLGDYKEAEQAHHQAVETFSGLTREYPGESDYRRDLAMSGHNLGVLYVRIGRLADAEREYRQALPLLEQLAARESAESSPGADLARCLNSLGDVLWKSGRANQAEPTYRRSLDLWGVLATEFPQDTQYLQEVAGLHHNLGVLLYGVGRLTEAESSCREATKLFDQLHAAEPHKREPRHGQALAHLMLANVLGDTGRLEPAEEAFHRSLEHFEGLLADHPGVPIYPDEMSGALNGLGVLMWYAGRFDEAHEAYGRSLRLREQLAERFPDIPKYRGTLGDSLTNVASTHGRLGRLAESERANRRAIEIRERLVDDFPDEPYHRRALADSYNNLAVLLRNADRPSEAEELLRQALPLYRQVVAEPRVRPEDQCALGAALMNLGDVLRDRGALDAARQLHQDAVAVQREAFASNPRSSMFRNLLAHSYRSLIKTLVNMQVHDDAQRVRDEALEWVRANGLEDEHAAGFRAALDEARPLAPERLERFRRAAEQAEANPEGLNNYAWMLLTIEPADLRDPEAALELARRANDLTNYDNPLYLDTLALAYHLSGDMPRALETQQEALSLLTEDQESYRPEMEANLAKYKAALEQSAEDE